MGSYRYARVRPMSEHVCLESTDSEMLERILAEVKKLIPSCSVRDKRELPSGELYFYVIYNLRGKGWSVATWIVKQLCLQGWEPFAIRETDYELVHIHFRYKG